MKLALREASQILFSTSILIGKSLLSTKPEVLFSMVAPHSWEEVSEPYNVTTRHWNWSLNLFEEVDQRHSDVFRLFNHKPFGEERD